MQGTAMTKTNSDTVSPCCENHSKHINAFYEQNAKISHVKACGTYIPPYFEDLQQGKMNILYEKFG